MRWRTGRERQRWSLCLDFPQTWGPDRPLWRRRKRECNGAQRRGWRTPAPVGEAESALGQPAPRWISHADFATLASIDLESWFWNKNLILLFPSSDDPFSWENLYLHSTACDNGRVWNSLFSLIQHLLPSRGPMCFQWNTAQRQQIAAITAAWDASLLFLPLGNLTSNSNFTSNSSAFFTDSYRWWVNKRRASSQATAGFSAQVDSWRCRSR